ncbi:MAG: YtxH domain-containing protein [Pseudoclavibacter sp.]
MKKFVFVLGLGAGYVLGARAGRKRYDQISSVAKTVWDTKLVRARRADVDEFSRKLAPKVADAAVSGAKLVTAQVTKAVKDNGKKASSSKSQPPAPTGTVGNPSSDAS